MSHNPNTVVGEEPIGELEQLTEVSIAFLVDSMFEVTVSPGHKAGDDNGRDGHVLEGLGGLVLTQRCVDEPWIKDHDGNGDGGLAVSAQRFDLANWGLLTARRDGRLVGGAVIACKTPQVHLLENRDDLAVLWDLRIQPDCRGDGVGTALFRASENWAIERGCRYLKVETQNINVRACHFYRQMGCVLRSIDRFAYPDHPDEVQLIWWQEL